MKVSLVKLQNVWKRIERKTLLLEVLFKIAKTRDVFFHLVPVRISDENNSVDVPQYELARRVVNDLPWNGVQLEFCFEPVEWDSVQRQKIKEQRAVGGSCERDEIASVRRRDSGMDIHQVGRLSAERSSVVHDLKLDLFTGVVDGRHRLITMASNRSRTSFMLTGTRREPHENKTGAGSSSILKADDFSGLKSPVR